MADKTCSAKALQVSGPFEVPPCNPSTAPKPRFTSVVLWDSEAAGFYRSIGIRYLGATESTVVWRMRLRYNWRWQISHNFRYQLLLPFCLFSWFFRRNESTWINFFFKLFKYIWKTFFSLRRGGEHFSVFTHWSCIMVQGVTLLL